MAPRPRPRGGAVAALIRGAVAALVVAASALATLATGPDPARAADLPFTFNEAAYQVRDIGFWARPFSRSTPMPRKDAGVHDAKGVRMRIVRGGMYDFPRGQATYGLLNLSSYVLTDDAFYLDRALAQARRLVKTRVEAGAAWYFPVRPSGYRHGLGAEPIAAPYYMALVQGRVLMFFSRLAEVTGDDQWRNAADHTFASFLRRGPRSGPYVVRVDGRGYYWLEEWPWKGMVPDRTFNGHNSAAFGLYEYFHLTQDDRARALYRGAATTAQHYAGQFRQPGWISIYCLAHRGTNPFYHELHVGELLKHYSMTGAVPFVRLADRFDDDYPRPKLTGRVRIEPGTYALLRFDSASRIVARRTVRVTGTMNVKATRRQRQRGLPGSYFRLASGDFAGFWLLERPGRVYRPGVIVRHRYDPPVRLRLAADGVYWAVKVDRAGKVLDRVALRPTEDLATAVDQRAVVNGFQRVRLGEGELAGYWVRLVEGVRLY